MQGTNSGEKETMPALGQVSATYEMKGDIRFIKEISPDKIVVSAKGGNTFVLSTDLNELHQLEIGDYEVCNQL